VHIDHRGTGAFVIKVLLVASDERVRDRLKLALERLEVNGEEIDFIEVSDGNAAVAVAEARHPDLVVVEVGVTPYGAFGITRDIKASPQTACPVIIVLERPQDEWLARWSGADALVNRPIDPFALADVARRLIEEHRGVVPATEEATS
jgi:DNA-binding response OmpR family regulator